MYIPKGEADINAPREWRGMLPERFDFDYIKGAVLPF